MRTFKYLDTIHCANESVKNFLVKYAHEKGVPVYYGTTELTEPYSQWPNLTFGTSRIICSNKSGLADIGGNREWITIEQFIQYCDNWKECQAIEIRISNDYTACIFRNIGVVEVGCQTIAFDKIAEIYRECFPE